LQVIAGRKAGGKSELHRAECRVTPGQGDLRKVPQKSNREPLEGRKGETAG